ncbi:class I SAM-dependent methyltransferase [Marinimicrobium alkaliphilum]|uniref:class I SAM-dependent methyltransferase n=1 Tax=Marinimicrobium alkaliphilum TaxID=2202654 RepID=UPI0018E09972|nr:class I SAM-dependent methyltransferase [Marinimicrobium alkaliphilum]
MKAIPLLLCTTALMIGCGPGDTDTPLEPQAEAAAPFTAAALQTMVDGEHRAAANRDRDRYRNPVSTLQFFDIHPEHHVIEINPGGGWYAEILAPLLHEHGRYTAAIIDPDLPDMPAYVPRLAEMINQLLAQDEALYGEAHIHRYNPAEPVLGETNSADRVLTFRNVHGWINGGQAEGMFAAFYDVLKPGGVLGVVQHRAEDGADYRETAQSGYVPESAVIALAEAAGFRLDERSDINANPNDTRDHPRGVWTLPPSLALGDENRERYMEIGESDRMTLRFVKD